MIKSLSIITVCYNEPDLEKTCNSIVNQTWQSFEWVVIDGGSNKKTLDIFEKYKHRIDYFSSKKDNGIYDAMNKGLKIATGKYVLFLNAGDSLYNEKVLEKVSQILTEQNGDIFYGDTQFNMLDGSTKYKCLPPSLNIEFFMHDSINHPAAFIKKELFEVYGDYNEEYQIVSDWEKWIAFYLKGAKYIQIPMVCSIHNYNGVSATSYEQVKEERENVLNKYKLKSNFPYNEKTLFPKSASTEIVDFAPAPELIIANGCKEDISVTVVIPVYNVEKYLEACLETVVNQSLKNIEIICIDDSSIDNSLNILKECALKDNRISVYKYTLNSGTANCRNWGVKLAKGKYIAYLDSDDLLENDFLFNLYQMAETKNCDVVKGGMIVSSNGNSYISDMNIKIEKDIKKNNFIGQSWQHEFTTAIYKKEFLEKNNIQFPQLTNGEDIIFILKVLSYRPNFKIVNNTHYIYQQRFDSASIPRTLSPALHLIEHFYKQIDILQTIDLNKNEYASYCHNNILQRIIDFWWYKSFEPNLKDVELDIIIHKCNYLFIKIGCFDKILKKFIKYYDKNYLLCERLLLNAELHNKLELERKKFYKGSIITRYCSADVKIIQLFGILPICSYKKSNRKKIWKILGIEVFKKKEINANKVKYYFAGIPVMKVTKDIL